MKATSLKEVFGLPIQLLSLALLAAALYFFYRNGYFPIHSRFAFLYVGCSPFRPERNQIGAHFSNCRGWERWRLPLRSGVTYQLRLDSQLKAGTLTVEIRESKSGLLVALDRSCDRTTLTAQPGKRYTATVRMEGASGSYTMIWDRQ